MGLLLYSHLPVALTALVFSLYVLIKSKNLPSVLLFSMCSAFTIWCAFDLSAWFSFLGSANTMFVWSLLDFMAVMMFFLGYYFLYTFTTGRDLPLWQKIVGIIIMLPTAYVAFLGLNIPTYDLNSCAALEDGARTIYTYYTEALFIIVSIFFVIFQYRRSKDPIEKKRTLLAGIGVLIFFCVFFSASFLVSQLAATDASLYVYNYLIYGLFGMPVFLIYLGYLIVRYHAFDLRVLTAQALSVAIVVLVATQYAFLSVPSSIVLNSVNLVLVSAASLYLTRNVRKEILLREQLAVANKGQENLIHIMNHQIKGYLGKDRSAFAELLSGDYGQIPNEARALIQEGLNQATKGVEYVQGILRGASAANGTLPYNMKSENILAMVNRVVGEQKEVAEKAGLIFKSNIIAGDYKIKCDLIQLEEAFRNLITNAIKYNSTGGSVTVNLMSASGKIRFSVKDTGVGISNEDKPKLFTAGGMGKDSIKQNTDASGFGLAFVKGVVEAHGGIVGYKPNGSEKGTTFFIELPVTQI